MDEPAIREVSGESFDESERGAVIIGAALLDAALEEPSRVAMEKRSMIAAAVVLGLIGMGSCAVGVRTVHGMHERDMLGRAEAIRVFQAIRTHEIAMDRAQGHFVGAPLWPSTEHGVMTLSPWGDAPGGWAQMGLRSHPDVRCRYRVVTGSTSRYQDVSFVAFAFCDRDGDGRHIATFITWDHGPPESVMRID